MLPREALGAVARRFALLGDPSRLRVLNELMQTGGASVGELAAATGLSQPNVSQHLARLTMGGIVSGRREGTRVVYGITDDSVEQLCELVCTAERQRREQALTMFGEPATVRK